MSKNREDKKVMLIKPTRNPGNAKRVTREEETPAQKVKRIQWELMLLHYRNNGGSINLLQDTFDNFLIYPLNSEKHRRITLINRLKNELSKANEHIQHQTELDPHDC